MSDAQPRPAPNPVSLTGAQRRTLRGLGHHLKACVQIGKAGVTEGLIASTQAALRDHELIKISVNAEAPVDRKAGPALLAEQVGAHVAQVIGRTALLYRRRFDDPQIQLPGVVIEAPRPAAPAADSENAAERSAGGAAGGAAE